MLPLLVLLPRIGYLHLFGIKIANIVRGTANKNMNMVEIFLKSPNVRLGRAIAPQFLHRLTRKESNVPKLKSS